MARFFGILSAVVIHVGVLLFGGLIFAGQEEGHGTVREVDLLSDEPVDDKKDTEKEEPDEPDAEKQEEMEAEVEQPPDTAEILRNLELSAAAAAPELEAASLQAIEAALSGRGGGGDFAEALSLSSGGRIGGMGKPGVLGDQLERAFDLTDIDQEPRPIFQASPVYPAEMRGKKMEGVVNVYFIVDASGKVTDPRVAKSSHPAFDAPALEAIRQWKFDAAVKAGKRVPCKTKVTIRFQPR